MPGPTSALFRHYSVMSTSAPQHVICTSRCNACRPSLCANINETNATALMTEQGGEDSSQDEPSASTVAGTRPGGPRSGGPTRTASLYSRVQETHPGLSRCGERKGRYGPIAAPRGTLFVDAGQWASRAGIRSGQSVLTEAWTGAET